MSGTLHPQKGLFGACCVHLVTQLQKPHVSGKVSQQEKPLPKQKRLSKKFASLYVKYFPKAHVLQSVQHFSITSNLSRFPANTYESSLSVGPPELEKNPVPWKAQGLKPRAVLINWIPSRSMSDPSKELVAACEASSICFRKNMKNASC